MNRFFDNIKLLDVGLSLVFIQHIVYFVYLYTKDYIFLILYFLFIFPLFFLVRFKTNKIKYYFVILLFFILFMISSFFSREFSVLVSWYNLLYALAGMLGAYFYINSKKGILYSKISFFMYVVFLSFFIFKYGADGEAYNNILEGSSRNYLSAISIFLTINIYVQLIFREKEILIYPAIINLILCLMLFGRSGIIISSVVFLFVLYLRNIKFFLFSLFLIFVFFILYLSVFLMYLDERTNFAIGFESDRSIFLKEYMLNIFNGSDFLTGRKISECCSYIASFSGNPHNSFIMGHLRYGLIHTVFSILLILFVLLKRNLIMLFFLLIIYSRFFLDQLGLFAFFDFFIFIVLYCCILQDKKKSNNLSAI